MGTIYFDSSPQPSVLDGIGAAEPGPDALFPPSQAFRLRYIHMTERKESPSPGGVANRAAPQE